MIRETRSFEVNAGRSVGPGKVRRPLSHPTQVDRAVKRKGRRVTDGGGISRWRAGATCFAGRELTEDAFIRAEFPFPRRLSQIAPDRFVRWIRLEEGRQPTDLAKDEIKQVFAL